MKKGSKTDSKKYYDICKKSLEEYHRDLYKYPLARLDDGDCNAFKDYPHKPPPKFTKKYTKKENHQSIISHQTKKKHQILNILLLLLRTRKPHLQ